MFLFIFESLGTQELILIGMVALIVFGPRKLPELAKKAGGFIREMRSVSNDFRSTWEKEVSFEDESENTILSGEENSILPEDTVEQSADENKHNDKSEPSILPEVREVSEEEFKKLTKGNNKEPKSADSDKQNWL